MRNTITDEEFYRVLKLNAFQSSQDDPTYWEFSTDNFITSLCSDCALSDSQIEFLCHSAITAYHGFSDKLLKLLELKEKHIDILLGARFDTDREKVFLHCRWLSQNRIEIGLNDRCPEVRLAAYDHSCCTEAQKVAYHLKYGVDND